MTLFLLALAALCIGIDVIWLHTRNNELERRCDLLAQRVSQLEARRSDEARHLKIMTERALEMAEELDRQEELF